MANNMKRSIATNSDGKWKSNRIETNPTLLDIDDLFEYNLAPKIDFKIAKEYDWTQSSATNYSKKYESIPFVEYEYSKSLIDYTFHGYYSKERQENVHNIIIDYYKRIAIEKIKASPYLSSNPWILFTAGPMGAGKTHTLQWLDQLDVIPLS